MASKYAALPDLDVSQDIYETPDLVDDVSTIPTNDRSTSPISEEGRREDIDHAHLSLKAARNKFKDSSVDAQDVDFSDRVGGKRRSYRSSMRRRRRRVDDEEYDYEAEEEEDDVYGEETLERKLARLRREVEELRGEMNAREAEKLAEREAEEGEEEEGEEEEEEAVRGGIEELSEVLEGLQTVNAEERGAHAKLAKKLAGSLDVAVPDVETIEEEEEKVENEEETTPPPINSSMTAATYSVTYAPSYKKSHALAKAADFDNRITILEKALGLSSSALANIDKQLPSSAMIPTLVELQRQVTILSNSTGSSLDAASRRVKQLVSETEKLADARKAAKAASEGRRDDGEGAVDNSERDAKINALYGALPTIESLAPLLPAVLDRLRSLRSIHADAGKTVAGLEKVVRRQEEMAGEIQRWREALEKVEGVVKDGEGRIEGNMAKVEEWVKELEEKMKMTEGMA
ncbi:hypothetical protein RUND412_008003 [Rhizina undulata]